MKGIIYLLLSIFLLSSVLGIEECKGTMHNNEVPCLVLLPTDQSLYPCVNINVSFYKNASILLYNQTMQEYSYFTCNATFNGTEIGTYTFYYNSTGDSGSIIIEEDIDNRYYLYVIFIVVFLSLIALGYYKEENIFIILAGMMACAISLNIFLNGFPNLNNEFLKNTISIVLAGIGFYFIISPSISYFESWREQ